MNTGPVVLTESPIGVALQVVDAKTPQAMLKVESEDVRINSGFVSFPHLIQKLCEELTGLMI